MSETIRNLSKHCVIPIIAKIINNEYNSELVVPRRELRSKGIFTHSNINQVLRNKKIIKDFGETKVVIETVIRYMISIGWLQKIEKDELDRLGIGRAYRVSDHIMLAIKNKCIDIL